MSDFTLVRARRAILVSMLALVLSLGTAAYVAWTTTDNGGLASGVPSTVQLLPTLPTGTATNLEVVVHANRNRPGDVEVRVDVNPIGGTLGPGRVANPGTNAFTTSASTTTAHPGGLEGISVLFPVQSPAAGATSYRIRLIDEDGATYFEHKINVTFL